MKKEIKKILEKSKKQWLDIGCGASKTEGFIGMDVRPLPGVDIVHNLEKYPWPFDDETFDLVHASHVLEHITPNNTDPRLVGLIDLLLKKNVVSKKEIKENLGEYEIFGNFMTLMDEIWRVTKLGGKFHFVVPYAGSSGFWQDPTHVNPISEATVFYFDPTHASGLWNIYKAKPWHIEVNTYQMNGFLEVLLKKVVITEKAITTKKHEKSSKKK